jgi:hypothetical protein
MRLFFSNFVQASAGQSGEVQIFFGQLVSHPLSKTPPAEAVVRQDVGVTMTIFEYKRMVTMLAGMVPKFEEMAASQMASLEEPALPPPPGFEK